MEPFKRKGLKLKISFATLGFLIAAAIWAYSEFTDSSHPRLLDFPLWTLFILLCPTCLLSIPLIDVEPESIDFTIMWFVIALLNSALYAGVVTIIERIRNLPKLDLK